MLTRVFWRPFGAAKGIVLAAILCCAFGMGPTVAVFGIFDRLLFRPLPFSSPERLVQISLVTNRDSPVPQAFLPVVYSDALETHTEIFSGVGWVDGASLVSTFPSPGGNPLALTGITANALNVLGVTPVAGRGLQPSDDENPFLRLVLLTNESWVGRFGGSPAVLGLTWTDTNRSLAITYKVVGILPKGFLLPSSHLVGQIDGIYGFRQKLRSASGALRTAPFARLQAGVSLAQAEAVANHVAAGAWQAGTASKTARHLTVEPLRAGIGSLVRPQLLVLVGAVWGLYGLALADLMLLLLVWSLSRERDIGIRLALGAGSRRVVGTALSESTAICSLGAFVAWLSYAAAGNMLVVAVPGELSSFAVSATDPRVIFMTVCAAVLASASSTIVPARAAAGLDILAVLDGRRRASTLGRMRSFQALLTVQTMLMVVLLSGALSTVPAYLTFLLRLSNIQVKDLYVVDVYHQLVDAAAGHKLVTAARVGGVLEAVRSVDGVTQAGASLDYPLNDQPDNQPGFWTDRGTLGSVRAISGGFLEALNVRMLAGRSISDGDIARSGLVAVLNRSAVSALWPGLDPSAALQRFVRTRDGQRSVIGVVADYGFQTSTPSIPTMFIPLTAEEATAAQSALPVVLRMEQGRVPNPRELAAALDRRFPAQTVRVQSVEHLLAPSIRTPRLLAIVLGGLAAVSVVLVGCALFATIRFEVIRRRQELLVRAALGATVSHIRRTAISFVLWPSFVGVAAGLLLSVWTGAAVEAATSSISLDPYAYAIAGAAVWCIVIATGLIAVLPLTRPGQLTTLALREL